MSLKSTSEQYGTVAVTIHWLTAILILILIGSGFRADYAQEAGDKIDVLRVHLPAGIAVLLLTVARIVWWLLADKKPAPVEMNIWQDRASRLVHLLLYIVILGMAASGIGMMVLSGAGPIIFGFSSAALPDFWDYPPRFPHAIGFRIIIALLVLHAGAALHHHFVKKDGLLRRMWYRRQAK